MPLLKLRKQTHKKQKTKKRASYIIATFGTLAKRTFAEVQEMNTICLQNLPSISHSLLT